MDVKREGVVRRKRIRLAMVLFLVSTAAAYAGWRVSRLKPAAPAVERGILILDTVRRGTMLRDVRGIGTLVPEEIVWIPAAFESQVSKILVKSGEQVGANTPIVILTNPDMELAANDLEWQIKQAEANLADLEVRLESANLDLHSSLATTVSNLHQAELAKDRDEQLSKWGLKADVETQVSVAKWEELKQRCELDQERIKILKDSQKAQLEVARLQVEKLKESYALKRRQVDQLTVRAGTPGVVQEMTLQAGQRVRPGDVLAKVAQPSKLMARLQIAEAQAKDILIGQRASIDTRNGIIPARVSRIDPNATNGTRTIECRLEGALPKGAVPDLSVDGTVEIERLTDILYIGRPVSAQPNSEAGIFRIDPATQEAVRVAVRLGRASVNRIEVVDGLKAGDQVILSDIPAQDQSERIRLN